MTESTAVIRPSQPAMPVVPTEGAQNSCSLQAQASFLTQAHRKSKPTDDASQQTPQKRLRTETAGAEQPGPPQKVAVSAVSVPESQPTSPPSGPAECQHPQQQAPYPADSSCGGNCREGQDRPIAAAVQPNHLHQQQVEAHHQLVHHQVPEAVEHALPPVTTTTTAQEAEEAEDIEFIDFDPLLFIRSLPPLEQVVPKNREVILPRKTRLCKQKTLVLDLDETLVHSSLEAVASSDFTFPVQFNNQEHVIHVKQRPHLQLFMNRVAELFEVVVFTASQKIYAEKLLNIIDPTRKLIKHRIFRDSCVVWDGNYVKDLTVLGRDLRTTLIVDNSPQAFGFQVDNGVPIESWYDDDSDEELLKMLPFLESLVDAEDVRLPIQRKFRMRELIEKAC